MKKILTLLSIVIMAQVFANCSSTKPAAASSDRSAATETPKTTDAEATIAEIRKSYTERQINEGKTIWETKCNKCHKLYLPADRRIAQWETILPRMFKRSKLDEKQAGMVRAYILTHTRTS